MKKSNLMIATLLITPVLILAQPAVKRQSEPRGQADMRIARNFSYRGSNDLRLIDLLKLTDQQRAEHKKINIKYQRLNIPLRSDLRLANLDLQEAMENLEQKKIDEALRKINDLNAKLFNNRINLKIDLLKTLTEEQMKILKDRPFYRFNPDRMQLRPGTWGDMDDFDPEMGSHYGFGWDLPLLMDDSEMEIEPKD